VNNNNSKGNIPIYQYINTYFLSEIYGNSIDNNSFINIKLRNNNIIHSKVYSFSQFNLRLLIFVNFY